MKWSLKTKSVNSKPLFEEINELVILAFADTGVAWASDAQRHGFTEMFDELLIQFFEEDKIDQWNVQCNLKNNTSEDMDAGKYVFELSYKQRNCLNVTKLIYTIHDERRSSEDDEILDLLNLLP